MYEGRGDVIFIARRTISMLRDNFDIIPKEILESRLGGFPANKHLHGYLVYMQSSFTGLNVLTRLAT